MYTQHCTIEYCTHTRFRTSIYFVVIRECLKFLSHVGKASISLLVEDYNIASSQVKPKDQIVSKMYLTVFIFSRIKYL